jgi:hypothetical protein
LSGHVAGQAIMSPETIPMTISTLKDLYIDQLQNLYSANRQAVKVTRELKEAANSA